MTREKEDPRVKVGGAQWGPGEGDGAAEALSYLGRNYPECLDALRVLDAH